MLVRRMWLGMAGTWAALVLAVGVAAADAKWTFMVYVAADNDLETYGILDFLEMAQVGSDDHLKIVVMFDRSPLYATSYGNWSDTRRGLVAAGDTPTATWGESVGEKNMGDGATVTEFIDWATGNFPAERYALIFWNHGDGWRTAAAQALRQWREATRPADKAAAEARLWELASPRTRAAGDLATAVAEIDKRTKAVCWDFTDNDALSLKELQEAMDAADVDVDLVGFDACLMGMLEIGYQLRHVGAEVMVASEETEPVHGWPYDDLLSDLKSDPDATPAQLGAWIADRYFASYGQRWTQSAVNLAGYAELGTAVANLATAMIADHEDDPAAVRAAARTVLDRLDEVVICNRAGTEYPGASGVAISFPVGGSDPGYHAANLDFVADTPWGDFLDAYAAGMAGSWVAHARQAAQSFFDYTYLDLGDFCRRLASYQPPQPGFIEVREDLPGMIGGGKAKHWRADDACWLYNLPFPFPFYGAVHHQVYVDSNGYLDFADGTPRHQNSSSGLIGARRIAPLWDDLDTSGGDIYVHQPSAESVCFRWQAREWHWSGAGDPVNMEVVLYRDGRVRFHYGDGNATLTPTVGLSAGDGRTHDLSAHYDGAANLAHARSLSFTPLGASPVLLYDPAGFTEAEANDGAIGNVVRITLANDSFTADAVAAGLVTAEHVPSGLTATFTRNHEHRITMTLAGKAVAHRAADSIANLAVTFADGAFAGGDAGAVANSVKDDLPVTFADIIHTVSFNLAGLGTIYGQRVQQVADGGKCTPVRAAAALGHHFTGWTGDFVGMDNPLTVVNVLTDQSIVANFAVNHYTVVFVAGPGGTVAGAAAVTQVVAHGGTTVAVAAEPAPGCLFNGWSGAYEGMANPLRLESVTGDRAVTATFLDTVGMVHLTVGSAFTVTAAEITGLAEFLAKPRLWGEYCDPVRDPLRLAGRSKGRATLLSAVSPRSPASSVQAEWRKPVCLFDRRAFRRALRDGMSAADWIAANPPRKLPLAQMLELRQDGAEFAGAYRTDLLAPPEIIGPVVNLGGGNLVVSGRYFGARKPKVWRECEVDGVIRRKRLQVLSPQDDSLRDTRGRVSYMNAADGASVLTVNIPASADGGTNGRIVIDNGIGMAVADEP